MGVGWRAGGNCGIDIMLLIDLQPAEDTDVVKSTYADIH